MKPLLQSFLAHLIVFIILILPPGKRSEPKEAGGEAKGNVPTTIEMTIIPRADGSGAEKKCKNWYGGIGIFVSYRPHETYGYSEVVTKIAEGYSADHAGLRVGDVIEGAQTIRGKPGTKVTLSVRREGVLRPITLTREKICTEN